MNRHLPSPATPESRTELPKLLDAYRLLSDTIVQATKVRFPTGEIVHWARRGHQQRGEVNGVLGFQAHNLRLRVMNTTTGKMVDLYLYEVQELRNGR